MGTGRHPDARLTYTERLSQSRPQTILFADVSGSTRLFETKGDVEARRLIAMVLDALSVICVQHGGRVIKTIGDEIMCTLPTAMAGVMAACDMQRKMSRDVNFLRESPLLLEVALHMPAATCEDRRIARKTAAARRRPLRDNQNPRGLRSRTAP